LTANSIYAGEEEYDDCLLEHLKNAKIDSATQLIKGACREIYRTPEPYQTEDMLIMNVS
jgi:hypothetical protein